MKYHNVEQKSQEWFDLRVKYPLTASEAQAIANNSKGLLTLCWNKVAEKYSEGERQEYSNEDLQRGIDLEHHARGLYEMETGKTVQEIGFITNKKYPMSGVSPDGLVGKDGLIEIKCFADTKYFKMMLEGVDIEPQYKYQMQMQLLITGRKWVDFVAFNPNYKKSLIIKRVVKDSEMQAEIVHGIKSGAKIIRQIESKLRKI